jgi:hypothetical protein
MNMNEIVYAFMLPTFCFVIKKQSHFIFLLENGYKTIIAVHADGTTRQEAKAEYSTARKICD